MSDSTTTPALTAEYRKVIPAKFVTKRDGKPMACMTCGSGLVMGQAYAATDGNNGWVSYCSTCAASPTAQIAGLVNRVETLVAPLGDNVPTEVTTLVAAATPLIETVLGGDTTNWLSAKRLLLSVREQIGVAKKAQRLSDLAEVRTLDPLYDALTVLANDRNWGARSLLDGWDKYGSLTPKQRAWAESMTVVGAAPLANGLYVSTLNGTVYKQYTTQNGRSGVKVLRVINGKGSFEYVKGGVSVLSLDVANGNARLLTQDEATAFGKQYGFCVNCALDLTDDRSLAVGYGPTCAGNYGWFYPTAAEAAAMLARPQGMLVAPPSGAAVNLPAPTV